MKCDVCKEQLEEVGLQLCPKCAALPPVRSEPLLDAVLMATNKWRCEMWSLRLHVSTPDALRPIIAKIMDRQLELEEQAKASNDRLHGREGSEAE